jgi:hypothetical protein
MRPDGSSGHGRLEIDAGGIAHARVAPGERINQPEVWSDQHRVDDSRWDDAS